MTIAIGTRLGPYELVAAMAADTDRLLLFAALGIALGSIKS